MLDQSHKKRTEVCAIYIKDTEDSFADPVCEKDGLKEEVENYTKFIT